MSIDSSLKSGSGLGKHRNVLTRAERIERLTKTGKFNMSEGNPIGLIKVGNRKVAAGGKAAKKKDEAAAPAAAPAKGGAAKGGKK